MVTPIEYVSVIDTSANHKGLFGMPTYYEYVNTLTDGNVIICDNNGIHKAINKKDVEFDEELNLPKLYFRIPKDTEVNIKYSGKKETIGPYKTNKYVRFDIDGDFDTNEIDYEDLNYAWIFKSGPIVGDKYPDKLLINKSDLVYEPDWEIHYVADPYDFEFEGSEYLPEVNEEDKDEYMANIHTHGLLESYHHPEITLTIALQPQDASRILNAIGHKIAEGAKYKPFKEYTKLFDMKDITTGKIRHMPIKFIIFPEIVRGVQDTNLYLILPDEEGRFPGEPNCQYPFNMQECYAAEIHQINLVEKLITRKK